MYVMYTILLLVFVLFSVVLKPSDGHIHSQKIHDYGGEPVTVQTWTLSLVSACIVGLCGVVPLFLNKWIRLDKVDDNSPIMQSVLSFAVGGLLGDVWLHLLPESWGANKTEHKTIMTGLWVIVGLLTFMFVEKIAKLANNQNDSNSSNSSIGSEDKLLEKSDIKQTNISPTSNQPVIKSYIDISGYLNLFANVTDNFTHGLAIAASYTVNPLVGILTTIAIVCHEIPHEICDFAILLRSGFSIPSAIKAQLVTATGGIFGITVGLLAEQMGHCTTWMLPFTAGGFLYISMVSIIPELLEQNGYPWRQLLGVVSGIVVMAAVTIIERRSCAAMPNFNNHS